MNSACIQFYTVQISLSDVPLPRDFIRLPFESDSRKNHTLNATKF